jgi:CRP-like cAMP-binding protein
MGKVIYAWQNRDRVLALFGNGERNAVQAYGEYLREGVSLGSRPELVGGGLIRSAGGWSQVKSRFRKGEEERFDERILGSGEFVERTVAEAEEKIRRQFPVAQRQREAKEALETLCREENVTVAELLSGSRRKRVSVIRKMLIRMFVGELGLPQAEIARMLGITATAVAKTLARQE